VPVLDAAKRVLFGRALRSDEDRVRRLPLYRAMPIYASDAISSNAYATQEILIVLALGGAAALQYGLWVALAVVAVFAIVIAAYRQSVREYPGGGGDYRVVTVNLGRRWGVLSASALLIDYVLTVAVSVAAAVANIGSVIPVVADHRVWWAVGIIVAVALLNLRGWGASAPVSSLPTYLFIGAIVTVIITAVVRIALGEELSAPSAEWEIAETDSLTIVALIFLVARAFSSGTTALTGIGTLSSAVPSFKEPAGRNAARTLLIAGSISMALFVSITWLALHTRVQIVEDPSTLIGLPVGAQQQTVIVQIATAVFADIEWPVVLVAIATLLILVAAANTAFSGFPSLTSLLSRDGYLPKHMHLRGDRLAFKTGIVVLSIAAAVLVVVFGANVSSLIQLYIVGVFVSFSLTQWAMVRHWSGRLAQLSSTSERKRASRGRMINVIGLIMTTSVLIIVLVTKLSRGAWIVVLAIPVLVVVMMLISSHYDHVDREITAGDDEAATLPARVHALVLVSRLHRPAMRALAFARATRPDSLEAVTVSINPGETSELQRDWNRRQVPVTLRVLESPYRDITRPVIDYVRRIRREGPRDLVTVYIPEYVVGRWWERLLHNRSSLRLRTRLLLTPGVMVVSVPWQLSSSGEVAGRFSRLDDLIDDHDGLR
jgi:amino acid transporter